MADHISPFIRLNPADNVVVARKDVEAGTMVAEEGFTTVTPVPAGYKAAAREIKKERRADLKIQYLYRLCRGGYPGGHDDAQPQHFVRPCRSGLCLRA